MFQEQRGLTVGPNSNVSDVGTLRQRKFPQFPVSGEYVQALTQLVKFNTVNCFKTDIDLRLLSVSALQSTM